MSPRPRRDGRSGLRPPLFGLLAALVGGCGGVATDLPALEVEYAGCHRAFAGPICELREDRMLTLWVALPAAAEVMIEADGRPLDSPGVEVGLGRRYRVAPAPDSRKLVVRSPAAAPWTLVLRPPDSSRWWHDAKARVEDGDLDSARAVVEKARQQGLAEPRRALSILGRIARFAGETEEAQALLRRSIAAHRQQGEHLQETRDAAALFDLLFRRHDLTAAGEVLAALPRGWQGPAEAAYVASYHPARLAGATGDLRNALRWLEAAFSRAERLDLRIQWLEAGQVLARQLRELGLGREAAELSERLVDGMPDGYNPCWHGQLLNNLGWISLLALEAGESAPDPVELLRRALAIFEEECPLLPRLNVKTNILLAHLHGGRLRQVRRLLREVKELEPEPQLWLRLWLLEIEGRLALAEARPGDALRAYDELAELARAALSPEARWRAELGKGGALAALEQPGEALEAFAEADRLLGQASLTAPLAEGRATFVHQREESVRRYLDLLLAEGYAAEALTVARRARLRVLRAVLREDRLAHLPAEEQERWLRAVSSYHARRAALDAAVAGHWQLSKQSLRRVEAQRSTELRQLLRDLDDAWASLERWRPEPEPPPLPAGELLLVYHPLPAGWAGFARDAHGLAARRLGCEVEELAPAELGECLLTPFAEHIERARQVRVLPYGPLRQVDFHALPYAGDALLAARPVVYGLDVEPPAAPAAEPRRALVVADPGGDLPAARREARAVSRSLTTAGGWSPRSLRGPAADGAAVRDLLPRVELFHYAGHATFAGFGGWQSALPLAAGSRLTVGDVLTLERVPRWVVLSGCETGRSSRRAAAAGVSLAHAFVAAGAGGVVAATRPVADATALRLVEAFYDTWSGGAPAAGALRDAQLALRHEDPAADWSAFRLVAP